MIFIDTIHSYNHTIEEMRLSAKLTNAILMDDATFEGNEFDSAPGGVNRAINTFMLEDSGHWTKTELGTDSVVLLTRNY